MHRQIEAYALPSLSQRIFGEKQACDFAVLQTIVEIINKNFAKNHETRVGYMLGESRGSSDA